MANWTNARMSVLLETDHVDSFLSFFDPNAQRRFYRAFLNSVTAKKQNQELTLISLSCSCAWSAHASFLGGKRPSTENAQYIELEDAIRDCKVKALILYAKESGAGFEESFEFDSSDACVHYKARDLFPDPDEIEYITDTANF